MQKKKEKDKKSWRIYYDWENMLRTYTRRQRALKVRHYF